MLVLDQVAGEEYGQICQKTGNHNDLCILETNTLGITHAEAAGILARQWGLSEELAAPMEHHHAPQAVEDYLSQKVTQII